MGGFIADMVLVGILSLCAGIYAGSVWVSIGVLASTLLLMGRNKL